MKKIFVLMVFGFAAGLPTFMANASPAIMANVSPMVGTNVSPMVGRWSCWHEKMEIGDLTIEGNQILADAMLMNDGRYLFQAIKDDSNSDQVEYEGSVYVTFNGSDVAIDVTDIPLVKTAGGTLSLVETANAYKHLISGIADVRSSRTVVETIQDAEGKTITIPRIIMEDVSVKFYCEKFAGYRN